MDLESCIYNRVAFLHIDFCYLNTSDSIYYYRVNRVILSVPALYLYGLLKARKVVP